MSRKEALQVQMKAFLPELEKASEMPIRPTMRAAI